MIDPIQTPADAARMMGGAFPGHTMQRIRAPDGTYRYGYVSPEVLRTFGRGAAWFMDQDRVDHHWVHDEDRARFLAALERSAADLTPLDEELRIAHVDGNLRWVRSIGRPRRLADGTVIWDGVALDVTDRRAALDALQRTLSEARRSEASEGRLAWIAAYGIQGPLEDLRRNMAQLAVRRGGTPEVDAAVTAFMAFDRALGAARNLVAARTEEAMPAGAKLTPRQREIAGFLRAGASNREIAESLGLSEGTVKLHVSAILKRLDVRNRTEAARALRSAPSS
ncbi:MAG: LuxR C-terminal-related transcriptional regulator [Pseudomonadota bacterium]